jgi:hypothetical protein
MRIFLIEYGTQYYLHISQRLSRDEISQFISNGTAFTSNTVDIINILGEKANFKPYIQLLHFELDSQNKEIYKPIFVKGKALYCHEVFYTSSYEHYNEKSHISNSVVDQQEYFFVVTPGESFSPYEKLLLPFDALTWSFLLSTLVIAFVVIFIVDLMPKVVQNILYGLGVSSPMLNVISTFFGIAQKKLPFSNFGRIILITFVMVCVVLRNGYQGKKKYF